MMGQLEAVQPVEKTYVSDLQTYLIRNIQRHDPPWVIPPPIKGPATSDSAIMPVTKLVLVAHFSGGSSSHCTSVAMEYMPEPPIP